MAAPWMSFALKMRRAVTWRVTCRPSGQGPFRERLELGLEPGHQGESLAKRSSVKAFLSPSVGSASAIRRCWFLRVSTDHQRCKTQSGEGHLLPNATRYRRPVLSLKMAPVDQTGRVGRQRPKLQKPFTPHNRGKRRELERPIDQCSFGAGRAFGRCLSAALGILVASDSCTRAQCRVFLPGSSHCVPCKVRMARKWTR